MAVNNTKKKRRREIQMKATSFIFYFLRDSIGFYLVCIVQNAAFAHYY